MPKHSSGKQSFNGKNFIILPVVFSVIITIICCAFLIPTGRSYFEMSKLFFSDLDKSFAEPEKKSIFVPVEESSQSENTEKKTPNTVPISSIQYPVYGEQFGELIIEDCQIHCKLFFGDSRVELNDGVGLYTGSFIPGYGRTILIAGHNNTYFNGLKYAEKGQQIKIRTSYGDYVYEITDIQVKHHSDETAVDVGKREENLIVYTCYPFDELGLTPLRCFVYAKPVSGPVIDKNS